jgi:peptidylprolyl isomerase
MIARLIALAALLVVGTGAAPAPDAAKPAPGGAKGAPAAALTATATTPAAVVAAAVEGEWVAIAPADLLVMDLFPRDAAEELAGRRVVIQLIGPPYSQGWVNNIRALATAHWWDGTAIVRLQDNYVAQWGDPDADKPDLARPLPPGLQKMPGADYVAGKPGTCGNFADVCADPALRLFTSAEIRDSYTDHVGFSFGWPVAVAGSRSWPVHCYGTVGVGRDVAPDTGTGAELYAVIGQAPRQLDRNIAVVGRVIEGIDKLSSLPRGTADLGFYALPEQRTSILSIRLGSEVPDLPAYQYLSTSSASFARYVHVRANRQDEFYIQPAHGVDVCNVQVPVRRAPAPQVPVPEPITPPAK